MCARTNAVIFSFASRSHNHHTRRALALAFALLIGIGDLCDAAGALHLMSTARSQCFFARTAVRSVPIRSEAQTPRTRQAQCSDSETHLETRFVIARFLLRPKLSPTLSTNQYLAYITPDHLFELPGTPPPLQL